MVKLNDKKIRWIIKWKERGKSTKKLAITQKISPRRVQQIVKQYRDTGEIPKLKKPGREPIPISQEEVNLVLDGYKRYKCNALYLEDLIMRDKGKHMPHNRIHKVMLKHGLARREKNKQKRRKWVRYERKHSMEMWHTDWKELSDGRWIIVYEDDASRMIMSYGVFNEATTKHSIKVLEKGIAIHGIPDELLTDRGSQFYASEGEKKEKGDSRFEKHVRGLGIKQILCRVSHPQTNGKLERVYGLIEKKLPEFEGIDELVVWYNTVKPHKSLKWGWLETPSEAFIRKLPPNRILGMVDWFGD